MYNEHADRTKERHVRMNHLFCIIGKSASGKDSVYRQLLADGVLSLSRIVPYTTRPIREGEREGDQYHFRSLADYREDLAAGRVLEWRCYDTVFGPWYYYTMDDGQIDLDRASFLIIGTLESYRSLQDRFTAERVLPIYIEVEDGERLQRALDRERKEKKPRYAELCRRFLADSEDFSEEKLQAAGIGRRFENADMETCLEEIRTYIREMS